MVWTERVNDNIIFTSPKGREFTALWIGNNRTKAKKLGSFSPPKRKGTIFQDLDVDATRYPIPFIFEGENHDLTASLFFRTCDENGLWSIIHPTHGKLKLQLVSVTEKVQPVKSGNLTEFESDWVEPLDEDKTISDAEIAQQIEEQIKALNQASADQLAAISDQTTAGNIQALKDAASTAMSTITNGLESISELSTDIARITNEIQRATTSNLANPLVAVNSLATQINIASQAPALATDNISERISSYTSVIDVLAGTSVENPTPQARNFIAIKEISLSSLVATLPSIATTGDLSTRQEAISLAEAMALKFTEITNSLDADQELYSENLLENQYFSQSQSYSDMEKLIALGIKFLLLASFDLKIEKRFTLEKARAPIDVTISEYGSLGENEENFDLFISSNNLKNREILLLPAGKEVVVYV